MNQEQRLETEDDISGLNEPQLQSLYDSDDDSESCVEAVVESDTEK
jgi:hypothetical protein